jgi:hypothetical protein
MIRYEEHYGKKVWTNVEMDTLRKVQCLCLQCGKMDECPVAAALYSLCQEQDLALMVTRCPTWERRR